VVTDGHYALISNGPIFQQPKIFNFRRVYKAVSSDPTSQGFGFPQVKLYKDNALISDVNFSGPAGQSQGAIATYYFRDKCRGEWRFMGNLLDPNADAFNYFGESFDIQGNRLAVGQGLLAGGFFFSGVGTPPIVPPLPYAPRPFTIFRIVR